MNDCNHEVSRPGHSRLATCRSVKLNPTEAEHFCSLPLDDRLHLHIPAFMALAMECRRSEGFAPADTRDLHEDIVFYCAMFGLFLETGRTHHPVGLVKARYRHAEGDPAFFPAAIAACHRGSVIPDVRPDSIQEREPCAA